MYAQVAIKLNTLLRNGAYGIVMRGVQKCTRGCSSLRDRKRLPLCCIKLDTATDLYSGTGTIAQMLAAVASEVTGVEIVEEAVDAARENAKLNSLSNCSFIAGDVFKVLSEAGASMGLPDMMVLDPPREGMTPKALERILSYEVPRLVYVSCKPESLARDMETFAAHGYRIGRARCVDMFPWTRHVETVCCLYHQKKDFISVPYEPKNAEYLNQ